MTYGNNQLISAIRRAMLHATNRFSQPSSTRGSDNASRSSIVLEVIVIENCTAPMFTCFPAVPERHQFAMSKFAGILAGGLGLGYGGYYLSQRQEISKVRFCL